MTNNCTEPVNRFSGLVDGAAEYTTTSISGLSINDSFSIAASVCSTIKVSKQSQITAIQIDDADSTVIINDVEYKKLREAYDILDLMLATKSDVAVQEIIDQYRMLLAIQQDSQ
jgi:hypothetical protein